MLPRLLLLIAAAFLVATPAVAQRGSSSVGATGVPWQRTLEDGLALSKASGKPLLVCVNNDGEPASDSLARGRYRDPEFLKLMEGYVPVLASPVEHAARAHDGRGVRIPCPRFGRVVCAEHIALEPLVYERWFQGHRVAPRHVAISPKGEILFDLYLLSSLSVIDRELKKHGKFDGPLPLPRAHDERRLLASPDAGARELLEALFPESDDRGRARLVKDSLDARADVRHPQLARLGLADAAESVREASAKAIAGSPRGLPTELLVAAARVAYADEDAVQAIAAELVSRTSDPASVRRGTLLGAVHDRSDLVDERRWQRALAKTSGGTTTATTTVALDAPDERALEARVAELDVALAESPDDIASRTELAGLYLALGRLRQAAGQADIQYELDLARTEARRVVEQGGRRAPTEASAILTRADWLSYVPAEEAVSSAGKVLDDLLDDSASDTVLAAELLDVIAQARAEQASANQTGVPDAGWVADLAAATRLLMAHPRSTTWQRVAALDVLGGLELDGLHTELTLEALERDPTLPELHEHLRWHLLRDGDAAQVGDAYAALSARAARTQQSALRWFTAFARLQAADRLREEGRARAAEAAYLASLEGFAATLDDPSLVGGAEYMSLAHAGLAALHLERDEIPEAADNLIAAADLSPRALDLPDALGVTPRATARLVVAALRRAGSKALATSLQSLLDATDAGR